MVFDLNIIITSDGPIKFRDFEFLLISNFLDTSKMLKSK